MLSALQVRRRQELSQKILNRREPLGVGLKNHCFVGLAIEIAQEQGSTLVNYYGGSTQDWKKKIKINNSTPEHKRNRKMAQHALQEISA